MADHFPAKGEVAGDFGRWGEGGDDFPVGLVVAADISLLDEHATFDLTVADGGGGAIERADAQQADVGFPLGTGAEDLDSSGVEVGSDDRFDEQSRGAEEFSCRDVDDPVEAQYTTERALRIASERFAAGHGHAVANGSAAGVVVLDDGDSWHLDAADDGQSAVEVEEVVVGEFFAVELLSGDEAGAAAAAGLIDGATLVRVLAVAEFGLTIEDGGQLFGEGGVIAFLP